MKKYQKIAILLVTILSFLASIVFAATENSSALEEEANTQITAAITSKVEYVLEPIASNEKIEKIKDFKDEMTNKNLAQVYTDNYIVSLDSSSKELVGLYQRYAKYNLNTTEDKNIAENFINSKYSEMNLPSDYKLVYLEKFDDYVWEADYQKEYNGVYNMYEAVKVFFNPENKEIVALTIFNEKYTDTSSEAISEESAINSASTVSDEKIVNSELTLIKSNNYYDKENNDKSIHKAWVLTTEKENKIYVDSASGEIIGGDGFND